MIGIMYPVWNESMIFIIKVQMIDRILIFLKNKMI